MQAAGYLVSPTAELTAGMKDRKDHFDRRKSRFFLDIDRNSPSVIDNGDGTYRPNDIYINPEDYWMSVCRNAPSMFIYDNSYVKCRELTLSYNVPKSWLKNVVSGLTVSFVARNPFIVWKNIPNIDPDSNYNNTTGMGLEYGSLPSRRSYGFNVNVKF